MKQETIQEQAYRLRELAKNSKDVSASFRYLSKDSNRVIIKNS